MINSFCSFRQRIGRIQLFKKVAGWLQWLILSAALSAALTVIFGLPVILSRPGHLEYHPHWLLSKSWLVCGMMGGDGIMNAGDSMEGGHVNLGAWFGFHEILYDQLLIPEQITYRFKLARGATITCVFNKSNDNFEGVRLSTRPSNPSAYIYGSDTGEFIEKKVLKLPAPVQEDVWHQSRISFTKGAALLELDGQTVSVPCHPEGKPGRVGFRGTYGDTFVDDIVIRERGNSTPFKESFERQFQPSRVVSSLQGASLCVFVPLLFMTGVLRRYWRKESRLLLAGFAVLMCGMAVAFLFALLHIQESQPFRTLQQKARAKAEYEGSSSQQRAHAADLQEEFKKRHLMQPLDDATRIIFLGTSQTFGCGARTDSESFVAVLETMLNASAIGAKRFKCFNGGIDGSVARYLLKAYAETYLNANPALTVVDLSHNDYWEGTPDFAESLERILKLNKEARIKTIFVLEPASPDVFPDGFPTYADVIRVATEGGIPVVNAHEYLKRHCDDGFLFWDRIHPTTYGHRLMAECLLPEVMVELEETGR